MVALFFDFYLVHKVFNTVVSHCKAGPIHVGSRQQFVAAPKEVLPVLEASGEGKKGSVKTVAKK